MTETGTLKQRWDHKTIQLTVMDLTRAGKAEVANETCRTDDKYSTTLDPDKSVRSAPDSQTSSESTD